MTHPANPANGDSTPRSAAILVAAGRGERLGGGTPKQFRPLAGRPLFAYSLDLFDALDFVTEIVLVLPASGLPAEFEREMQGRRHAPRRAVGGARRQDSVAAGLEMAGLAAAGEPFDVALVHDVARPFADPARIGLLARRCAEKGGGLLAMPATDTVKIARVDGCVAETLDRRTIWLAQTPQAIRADLVPRAIEELRRAEVNVTDEAGLLERWGIDVALVESDAGNFKITEPADFARAEARLAH